MGKKSEGVLIAAIALACVLSIAMLAVNTSTIALAQENIVGTYQPFIYVAAMPNLV